MTRWTTIALIVALLNTFTVIGQEDNDDIYFAPPKQDTTTYIKRNLFYGTLATGLMTRSIAFQAAGNVSIKDNVLSIKYTYREQPLGFELSHIVALSFGRHFRENNFCLTPTVGVSMENGLKKGQKISSSWFSETYEKVTYSNQIGFNAELKGTFTGRAVGTGLTLFYNRNKERVLIGVLWHIDIGKVR